MFDEAEILPMNCNIMGSVLVNEQAEINCFTGHSESINSKASPNFRKMVVFVFNHIPLSPGIVVHRTPLLHCSLPPKLKTNTTILRKLGLAFELIDSE
jgi:hypothetical protein